MFSIKVILYLLTGLLLSGDLLAQSNAKAENEVQRILLAYRNAASCSIKVTTSLFKKETDSKPSRSLHFEASYSEVGNLIKTGNTEILTNSDCTITVDHEEKSIHYAKTSKESWIQSIERQRVLLPLLDTLFRTHNRITYTYSETADKLLVTAIPLKAKNGLNRTEYVYDLNKGFLSQVISYYTGANLLYQKAVAEYTYTDLSPAFSSDTFSEQNYISIKGDTAVLQNAYKNYQLKNTYSYTLKNYLHENK